jgi:hypothetical protein
MNVTEAFAAYQRHVNATSAEVNDAIRMRDLFSEAFLGEADVLELVVSGSFARRTHQRPIHDLDLVVIFDEEEHPDWGLPGTSGEEALRYAGKRVNALLGATNGTVAHEIRLASPRNHAVKCFRGDPDDPEFTVDLMPAFRRDGMLLIPESASQKWVPTNPEYLIREVLARQAEWHRYQGTVRILKGWAENWAGKRGTKIKSLVVEVLALDLLEEAGNRPTALKSFFLKAAWHIQNGNRVMDPAGICGEIQPDLDYEILGDALAECADLAARATSAAANNDQRKAVDFWGQVFGDGFPDPPPPPAKPQGPTPGVAPLPLAPGQEDEPVRRPIKDTAQG